MISCESFEKNWSDWQAERLSPQMASEMRAHSVECAHCNSYNADIDLLKNTLKNQPIYQPSEDFSANLKTAILSLKYKGRARPAPNQMLVPRWAVLSAGIITGFAISLLFLLPVEVNKPIETGLTVVAPSSTTSAPVANEQLAATPPQNRASEVQRDSAISKRDTTAPKGLYDPNRHSRMVSGESR